uniref:Uncharacterized protein LOC100179627 n=1 Tax=Phallusia mammillata TaxID=59560 RepID=A0A6F9DGC3_9ASCI|nr:uncharacterized protein LOC100179627 [Phallusia mammillata]
MKGKASCKMDSKQKRKCRADSTNSLRPRKKSNLSTSGNNPTTSTKHFTDPNDKKKRKIAKQEKTEIKQPGPSHNPVKDGQTSNPSTATQAGEDFCFSDTSNFTLNESSQVLSSPIGQGNDPTVRPAQQFRKSRALLLNNITCTGCNVRYGADRDSANLKNILEQLNFEVESHIDKRKEEMFHILREFTDSRKNEHAPMVLVFIGSHGHRDSANRDWFIDTNGEKISEEEVVNYFTPSNAPLIKKTTPKLFFFQFCRQIDREATQSDSIMGLEEPRTFEWLKKTTRSDTCIDTDRELVTSNPAQKYANMLFAFASAPGAAAIRNRNDGSWFVTALCKILIEHSLTEDLLSMLTMVNAAVMKKRGTVDNREVVQMCEVKSYLTEKVFMVPKESK